MVKYLGYVVVGVLLSIGVLFQSSVDGKSTNQGMYYENVRGSENVDIKNVSGINLDFEASLEAVGDSFDLYFDIVNSNDVDMKIENLVLKENDSYINYLLTYQDGGIVKKGDIIKSHDSIKLHYEVKYINLIKSDNYLFDTGFSINYEQVL